jgi:hypothetical protein
MRVNVIDTFVAVPIVRVETRIMHACMNESMYVCMYEWMSMCVYVWKYVFFYESLLYSMFHYKSNTTC